MLRIILALACSLSGTQLFLSQASYGQLRVVTYNTAMADPFGQVFTARSGLDTVLEAIGNESINGIAKPIDVLLLQEQQSTHQSTQSIVDVLNDIYGAGTYARSTISGQNTGPSGAGGAPALVYNTESVDLIGEIQFGDVGTGSDQQPRSTLRYQLRPVGYDSSADFYAYNSHYKADTGTIDQARRFVEAEAIRNNSDALREGTHAIYAGDYNIVRSTESMYQELLSSGNGQAFDPIDTPGSWRNDSSLKHVHTQSPASTSDSIPGLAGGGMDDRFDFQLVTGEFLDEEGLSYIDDSYRAFGNNGTHFCCNSSIDTGTGASPTVLNSLMTASDHLPVVADYQLPAAMYADVSMAPTNVMQGSLVNLDVMVENVANVLVPHGADELDYSISVSGDLLGGASGTNFALAGPNSHQVMLDTSTPGLKSGTVTVSTTSQSASDPIFSFPVNFVVGDGGGGPVFGVVAKDDFDSPMNLIGFSQDPSPGAYSSSQDGFQTYQVGTSGSIPSQLVDDSTNGNASDSLGIVNSAAKTDRWFGVTDTVNGDNLPVANPSVGTATWDFDVTGVTDLEVSIDMAAMGDFENDNDSFNWTYSLDGGPNLPLFTSSVDEAGSANYTMASGNQTFLNDPLLMTDLEGQTTELSNVFQTLTSELDGFGTTLTIELIATTDGGEEAYAFDNLTVRGTTFQSLLEADFNEDGNVDAMDLAQWEQDFGTSDGADADGDGDTDGADFLVWQRQFGQSASSTLGSASTSVPEPGTTTLLMSLLVMFFSLNRRGAYRTGM